MTELEQRILAAHAAGDTPTLERLQAEYRRAGVIRISPEPRLVRSGAGNSMVKDITDVYVTCAGRRGIARLEQELGDLEIGAVLLGAVEPEHGRVVVHEVNAVPIGKSHSININLGDFAHRERPGELLIVGDLHSHPSYQGERARASGPDLETWRHAAATLKQPIAGLILHPRGVRNDGFGAFVDWFNPFLSAWITLPDGTVRDARIRHEVPWMNELALKAGIRSPWGWS